MADVLGIVAVLGFFVSVVAGLYAAGARIRTRRRGGGAAVMGPFEEIWHPAAHRARVMTEVAEERMLPMPAPGDPPRSD